MFTLPSTVGPTIAAPACMGWAVICPHKNSARLGGAAPNNEWLTMDMEIISRCDAIYLMKGWRQSTGAVQEWRHAASLHLKVYEEGVNEPPEV